MKKRVIVAVIILVVVAALVAGGWWAWTEYGDAAPVDTSALSGSGTVEADEISVSSLIGGLVTSVDASEGDSVTSGTALFTLDDAMLLAQVDQATAGVKAAQATLDQAKTDKKTAQEITRAEAGLEEAKAALAIAQIQAGYASVTAPADGVVTQVAISEGENAQPGRTLATITDLGRLYVSIYVPETRISEVSIGDRASVTSQGSSRTFEGQVVFIASQAEFTPSNLQTAEQRAKLVYEVRLEIDNIGDELKPGMPVDVEF